MALNPRLWFPIAVVLTVVNVAAMWVVGRGLPGSSDHLLLHGVLAVGSAAWAVHLRLRLQKQIPAASRDQELAELRDDMETLREHVRELEERLDFAERLLSQAREWTRSRSNGGRKDPPNRDRIPMTIGARP